MITTSTSAGHRRRGVLAGSIALVAVLALAACQSGGKKGSGGGGTAATDDGTTLTLWTRAPTQAFTQSLVDAYNSSHKNKVKLTAFPADSYQQKVASAAGAKQLPDILASDVVYAPNYASAQMYDAVYVTANAVEKVGHDQKAIDKALAGTDYDGVCDFRNDKNNVLGRSVTIYKYAGPTDKTKVLVKKVNVDFVPNEELGAATTTVPAAPATTAAR